MSMLEFVKHLHSEMIKKEVPLDERNKIIASILRTVKTEEGIKAFLEGANSIK